MIGPWQLLALRENETAMDVSTYHTTVVHSVVGALSGYCKQVHFSYTAQLRKE